MLILGLQKLTLLDFPGRTACTIFTGGCNFRCPFCHNAPLVLDASAQTPYTEEEILAFLKKRQGLLDGVCVTGGEPTLHADLPILIEKIRALGYAVKLDTNGSHPEMLKSLVQEGLIEYVAMDIKSSPERYDEACGAAVDHQAIGESIDFLLKDTIDYEFRTTVVAELHDEAAIRAAAQRIHGAKRYFLQAFVDSGALIKTGFHALPREAMERLAEAARAYVPQTALRGV